MTVRFPNEEAARQWMAWHDGAGEQYFWQDTWKGGSTPKLSFEYDYDGLMVTATEAADATEG